ncbi:MAG: DUF3298 domain-containing protein [Oscillospiraceae bacterium]|nr:DUF3298 domain-containing protein [Oscillospiraceae bacterium]
MKTVISMLLSLTLALSLTACAGKTGSEETNPQTTEQTAETAQTAEQSAETVEQAATYTTEARTAETEITAEDGTVVGSTNYTLNYLTTDGGEEMQAVCKTFNDAMDAFAAEMYTEDSEFAVHSREVYEWQTSENIEFTPCYEEFSVTDTLMSDTMLSVVGAGSSYTGGAHPNNYMMAWNYDLQNGRFFTLNDLTDDPAALRAAIAEEIFAQIAAENDSEMYNEDYADTLRAAEDFNVYFTPDGAMTVWFDEYVIAPHAAGIPAFDVAMSVIDPYLNAAGAALLGR